MSFQLDLPDIDDEVAFTDWLEVILLSSNRKQVSRARIADVLAARLETSAQTLEIQVGHALQEIKRRRRVAGPGYPLSVDESIVRVEIEPRTAFYTFLLFVSLDGPMRRKGKFKEIDLLFDEVVRVALIAYLGTGTSALRFGWPVSGGRPPKFAKALDWLAERLGLPVGPGKHASSKKDGGVDVVAWKPFADHRPSFLLALAQCTVQADWHPKSKDIIDRVWDGCIDSGRSAQIALAIPFVVPRNYSKWDELKRLSNIVLDRLRITKLVNIIEADAPSELIDWIKRETDKLAIDPI